MPVPTTLLTPNGITGADHYLIRHPLPAKDGLPLQLQQHQHRPVAVKENDRLQTFRTSLKWKRNNSPKCQQIWTK